MSRASLSLCIIVKNEELRIKLLINQISSWVDEIVVVDTGSTDNTKQIASSCRAYVYDYPCRWNFSFGLARNLAMDHAQGI